MARLSRDLILGAALALIDDEGLDALTARRLASRLEAQPGALYHHFADMEDLLSEVAWRVVEPVIGFTYEGDSWQEHAIAHCRAFRTALLEHPNVIPVLAGPLGRRILTQRLYTRTAAQMETFLALLAGDGIKGAAALGVIEAVTTVAIGAATIATPLPAGAAVEPPAVGPRFAAVWAATGTDPEERFEFALRSLVTGMAAELCQKKTARR